MTDNDLPIRAHYEPRIGGPHEIVGEPGITHHYVFAGPNARKTHATAADPGEPIPAPAYEASLEQLAAAHHAAPRPRWQRIALRILDWLLLPLSVIAGGVLAMAWGSLNVRARLVVSAVVVVAAAGHWTILRARRRRART